MNDFSKFQAAKIIGINLRNIIFNKKKLLFNIFDLQKILDLSKKRNFQINKFFEIIEKSLKMDSFGKIKDLTCILKERENNRIEKKT